MNGARIGGAAWAIWKIALATATTFVEVSHAVLCTGARAILTTAREAFDPRCDAECAARDNCAGGCRRPVEEDGS